MLLSSSVWYNTCLPSSAPVVRLLSSTSLALTKRRNRLDDKLFETPAMLEVTEHD